MLFKYYLYHILTRELKEREGRYGKLKSFKESMEDVRSDTEVDYKRHFKGDKDS